MSLSLISLLGNGYFPKELPPPFNTTSYSVALATAGNIVPNSILSGKPQFSKLCKHSLVRAGGLRRILGIPNPKHYYLLANHIVLNWTSLITAANRSPFSLTKPTEIGSERAITPEFSLSTRTEKLADLRSSSHFILKADIARFFPSIYTHSIPWAIMGKKAAKSAHAANSLKGSWQDLCDSYAQKTNNNQTIGIPIGPDTSRLLAEVVLSEVDILLAAKVRKLKGIRYIDDYEFAFSTRSDAEKLLNYIQSILNEFELALNTSKTRIVELPEPLDALPVSTLRTFLFRDAGISGQKNDLTNYFNLVFEYLKKGPDEGLIKYAIARLNGVEINAENWLFYQNILSQCIMAEPACLPQVCDQVIFYKNREYKISRKIWSDCLNLVISERVPMGLSSEAAWAMWLLKVLNIKLQMKSSRAVNECDDSIVGLMGLGLCSVGLADRSYLHGLSRFADSMGLYDDQWLLCYQGNLMKMLGAKSGKKNLVSDPFFDYLQKNDVSFFDINTTPVIDEGKMHILGLY
jgi:hypothetical protein